jgi:hypothetical protein
MVDSRLHKADVVAHNEENVGLLVRSSLRDGCLRLRFLLCLSLSGACQHGHACEDQTGGKSAEDGTENGPPHCVRHMRSLGAFMVFPFSVEELLDGASHTPQSSITPAAGRPIFYYQKNMRLIDLLQFYSAVILGTP